MEVNKVKKDFITMTILLIFSILLYAVLIPKYIPQRASVSGDIIFTSRTFPYIIAVFLGIISAIGAIKSGYLYFIRYSKVIKEETNNKTISMVNIKPYIIFSIIAAYGVMFEKFGIIISSVICLPLLLIIYGERKKLHYVEVVIFCSIMYLVFRFVLNIPLP